MILLVLRSFIIMATAVFSCSKRPLKAEGELAGAPSSKNQPFVVIEDDENVTVSADADHKAIRLSISEAQNLHLSGSIILLNATKFTYSRGLRIVVQFMCGTDLRFFVAVGDEIVTVPLSLLSAAEVLESNDKRCRVTFPHSLSNQEFTILVGTKGTLVSAHFPAVNVTDFKYTSGDSSAASLHAEMTIEISKATKSQVNFFLAASTNASNTDAQFKCLGGDLFELETSGPTSDGQYTGRSSAVPDSYAALSSFNCLMFAGLPISKPRLYDPDTKTSAPYTPSVYLDPTHRYVFYTNDEMQTGATVGQEQFCQFAARSAGLPDLSWLLAGVDTYKLLEGRDTKEIRNLLGDFFAESLAQALSGPTAASAKVSNVTTEFVTQLAPTSRIATYGDSDGVSYEYSDSCKLGSSSAASDTVSYQMPGSSLFDHWRAVVNSQPCDQPIHVYCLSSN